MGKVYSLQLTVYSVIFLFVALGGLFGANTCWAQTVLSSKQLIGEASTYDGKEVIYEGEVVGEAMARGDFVWLNVHDGEGAIGVWAPGGQSDSLIVHCGSYQAVGDRIRLRGVFHRACPQHGGDVDIHAESIHVVKKGFLVSRLASAQKVQLVYVSAGIFIFALCSVMILRYVRRYPGA